jgi:hypothetical protein
MCALDSPIRRGKPKFPFAIATAGVPSPVASDLHKSRFEDDPRLALPVELNKLSVIPGA